MRESMTWGQHLNKMKNHPLRGGWWLLDLETSGFDPLTDDIIAVRLAYMENYELHQELSFHVLPKYPLRPEIARLTGLNPEDMSQAIPVARAVKRIGMFVADAPLLIYHTEFALPFLRTAFHHYAEEEFLFPCLSLCKVASPVLNVSKRQRLDALAAQLPEPENRQPEDAELAKLYRVALATFKRLESSSGIQTVKDILLLYGVNGE